MEYLPDMVELIWGLGESLDDAFEIKYNLGRNILRSTPEHNASQHLPCDIQLFFKIFFI